MNIGKLQRLLRSGVGLQEHVDRIKKLEAELLHENDLFIEWRSRAEGYQIRINKLEQRLVHVGRSGDGRRILELEKAARYFIAEFEENWKESRVSIDCKNAADALQAIMGKANV